MTHSQHYPKTDNSYHRREISKTQNLQRCTIN